MSATGRSTRRCPRMSSPRADPAERIVGLYEENAAAFDRQRDRSLFEQPWLERFAALLPPGSTTTRVPTLTRSNRFSTSSFNMPMQPDETNLPIVEGWFVP